MGERHCRVWFSGVMCEVCERMWKCLEVMGVVWKMVRAVVRSVRKPRGSERASAVFALCLAWSWQGTWLGSSFTSCPQYTSF